jgi:hypothetical protein
MIIPEAEYSLYIFEKTEIDHANGFKIQSSLILTVGFYPVPIDTGC